MKTKYEQRLEFKKNISKTSEWKWSCRLDFVHTFYSKLWLCEYNGNSLWTDVLLTD